MLSLVSKDKPNFSIIEPADNGKQLTAKNGMA
jgi:hypothetical protein